MDFIVNDINNSLILRVSYHDDDGNVITSTCKCIDILKIDTSFIEYIEGNILNISNILTGLARFKIDNTDNEIIDIPLRNLNILYRIGYDLQKGGKGTDILLKDLHAFSSKDIMVIEPIIVDDKTYELEEILDITEKYNKDVDLNEEFQLINQFNDLMKDKNKKIRR